MFHQRMRQDIPYRRYTKYVLIIVVILTLAAGLFSSRHSDEAQAQDSKAKNVRTLLEFIDKKTTTDKGFLAILQFVQQITDEKTMVIGVTGDSKQTIMIKEIGDDYVCLDQYGGAGMAVWCVPFSNIASIFYYEE